MIIVDLADWVGPIKIQCRGGLAYTSPNKNGGGGATLYGENFDTRDLQRYVISRQPVELIGKKIATRIEVADATEHFK